MKTSSIDTNLLKSKMALNGYNSNKAFAEALGVTSATIGNLINGTHKPSHDLTDNIFRTLKLTPHEGTAIFFSNNLRKTKVII